MKDSVDIHISDSPSEIPSRASIDRLLRPRSVAIVGASATPGSLGEGVLTNLEQANFAGALYLVNPKHPEIHGRACVPSIDDLPKGVDCAVLAIPRTAVLSAVAACARRGIGSVIIFSSGFAESGDAGRAAQEELARIAREHRMIVEGPNCLGLVNYVDGTPLTFVATQTKPPFRSPGVAVISQSGAMAAVLGVNLRHNGMRISYSISTGNEAASGVEDFLEYLLGDEHTNVCTMIVEQFRQPRRFLKLAQRAREMGKFLVLLHPGSSQSARASAATHTGAMAGNHQVMRTKVAHAGVVVVDTLEELVDVSQLLTHCGAFLRGGPAVFTESGAFKALTFDLCERLGLALPPLTESARASLRSVLPDFILPDNPLDLTAQALVDTDLYRRTMPPFLADAQFGSLVLGIILTDTGTGDRKFPPILDAIRTLRPAKPVIFAALDEGAPISPGHVEELRGLGVPFFPSPERAFRALARLTEFSAQQNRLRPGNPEAPIGLSFPGGSLTEYQSKQLLAQMGISIPEGDLAHSSEEAHAIAERIGFPVALKAQSAELPHKSDVGGVILGLDDAAALTAGWRRLLENIESARPGLALDGVLVERMAEPGPLGIELIVGVKNDPQWGPVVLVGMGGVLAEALQDVRLLPPDLAGDTILSELRKLKGAALLQGFRGSPALDLQAVAELVQSLGALVSAYPAIQEIDINPVVVYPVGMGVLALDALIVTG